MENGLVVVAVAIVIVISIIIIIIIIFVVVVLSLSPSEFSEFNCLSACCPRAGLPRHHIILHFLVSVLFWYIYIFIILE